MNEITFEDLITKIKEYNPDAVENVTKAYQLAATLHEGQQRQSGEPYIIHPLNVCYILAEMHADEDTLCAGLLHDTLEDTELKKEDIIEEFNKTVANLVDGVTKISKMNFSTKEEENYANTRKIITSITEDVRIIIIKLADRLHNMRTLQFKKQNKQRENALETMEIYVPLAYYIGAYSIKSELEDLSFKYLKPDLYKKLSDQQRKIEIDNMETLEEMKYKINAMLNDRNIPNEIKIRFKNIYGIYKKLDSSGRISNIHDLLALKVLVDEIDQCYLALGIIHATYHPINNKFKDYICNPKTNMYRSLHSTVFTPDDKIVQTQIRTFDMDNVASHGLTAYWDIKKGEARIVMQEDLKKKYQFFKSLVQINEMFGDNKEFVSRVKKDILSDRIYIYASDGQRVELPKGSTIIDYAYMLDKEVAETMVAAVVNGEYVPVNSELHNKDIVKIVTDDLSYGSREKWLDQATTTYARKMIRRFNE